MRNYYSTQKTLGTGNIQPARIGPAFYDDDESSYLALQLLRVFRESGWNVNWESSHPKILKSLLDLHPVGVLIYTDDPHNQGAWLYWILKDLGVDAYVANDTPDGFRGTLICVGYKQLRKQVVP
jgi:hypothetical protein